MIAGKSPWTRAGDLIDEMVRLRLIPPQADTKPLHDLVKKHIAAAWNAGLQERSPSRKPRRREADNAR